MQRLQHALHAYGGALLADAPGMGKTYTALAVARSYGAVVVVAPAGLKSQWLRSAALAAVPVQWCSLETLSRRAVAFHAALLIVDEAHHLRNPHTQRYANAASLAIGKQVLLLSATPVHNRPTDRDALFALFLGSAASALRAETLACLVVRREAHRTLLPRRARLRWLAPPATPNVASLLRALPPPLPAADGREALALLRMTFTHAWSSSVAALDASVRRALHHAAAIDDALAAGRWPTRRELRAWVTTAESSQLTFPELVAAPTHISVPDARATLARHRRALDHLRTLLSVVRDDDATARAAMLRDLLSAHPTATIVAFSRYAATVDALWRALRFDGGVVAITARGVRSAGGGLRREDMLVALASSIKSDGRMPVRLVLSTELLGEGLDLRAASVIVHLDQPWTPARLDQREGRAMRLGSSHHAVTVYAVRPPRGAARTLALTRRLIQKRVAMNAGIAPGRTREALCALTRPWLHGAAGAARVAAVRAGTNGWVAVVRDASGHERVIMSDGSVVVENDERLLIALQNVTRGTSVTPLPVRVCQARRAIHRWRRADDSARLAQAHGGATSIRAMIARRFDDALRLSPLNQRAALQPRVAAALANISAHRSAGVERVLTVASRLASVEAILDAIAVLDHSPEDKQPALRRRRLLALLLFEPRE